jgi:hypothetical protein
MLEAVPADEPHQLLQFGNVHDRAGAERLQRIVGEFPFADIRSNAARPIVGVGDDLRHGQARGVDLAIDQDAGNPRVPGFLDRAIEASAPALSRMIAEADVERRQGDGEIGWEAVGVLRSPGHPYSGIRR